MVFLSVLIFKLLPRQEIPPVPIPDKEETIKQIIDLNTANSHIFSMSCSISSMGTRTEILYLKPNKIVATTVSPFGRKQAEVATDGKEYWFWMRDFDKDSVYHCPLSKVSTTRVVLPMRPNLVVSFLGVDEIRWDSMSVEEGVARLSSSEEDLSKLVTFEGGKITGVSYHRGETPEMTATFKSHQIIDGFEVPKVVNVSWHEQNSSFDLEIKDVLINIKNPPEIKMPEGMKKISLIGF
ncbi:hypothetical protein EBT16_01180 [bacterium]|nr:hypothetical protein [bacterium]